MVAADERDAIRVAHLRAARDVQRRKANALSLARGERSPQAARGVPRAGAYGQAGAGGWAGEG